MANTWMDGGTFVHTPPGGTLFQTFSPDVANQASVSFSTASASAAIPTTSRIFRLHADQACFINFGAGAATATSSHLPFDAGTEVIGIPEPYTHIAAIQNTTSGTLTITPMG